MAFFYMHEGAAPGVAWAADVRVHAYATGVGIADRVLEKLSVEQLIAGYRKASILLAATHQP